jgi:Flp pilus assembly protein TadD
MPPDFSAPSVNAVDLERILLGEGLAAMAEKDFTLAIPLLRRAAEISPASAMNLNAWAWALVCRGARSPAEARLALDAADRARRISGGSDPGITHTYAEALRQAGQQEDALEVLRGMMRASPSQRLMWRWMSGDTLNDAFFQREEARMVEGTRLPEPT